MMNLKRSQWNFFNSIHINFKRATDDNHEHRHHLCTDEEGKCNAPGKAVFVAVFNKLHKPHITSYRMSWTGDASLARHLEY